METYLNRNIKDVLADFPAIGPILEEYGIQCVSCAAGTCALGQIVDVHQLSAENETSLMNKIGAVLCPGKAVHVPKRSTKSGALAVPKQFSPPVQMLVDEHKVIKRLLAILPGLLRSPVAGTGTRFDTVAGALDFIGNYADRFHHAKEEDILFKHFDEKTAMVSAMCADHEAGRAHVRAAREAASRTDIGGLETHLTAYRELLLDHIRKEDDVLYPWMEGQLSVSQVGHLYSASIEIRNRPETKAAFYERWVDDLEKTFQDQER